MKLHKNAALFKDYVALISQEENIDEAIVVKDYFVVLALKKLYDHDSNLVFIGGTSLSKCFGIIERFSEDIDLASTLETRKGKQKQTFEAIQQVKNSWDGLVEADNKKFSDFKEMYLHYPTSKESDLDQRVKIELITFMEPFPIVKSQIYAMIYRYLDESEIKEFDMHPIVVNTQKPYRTMMEKILLEKELYKGYLNQVQLDESQEKRARDFYDIHKIWQYYDKKLPFDYEELQHMIQSRISNRRGRTTIQAKELNHYLLVEMFVNREIAKQLNEIDKRKLSIRDLDTEAIKISLFEIDIALKQLMEKKVKS